LKYWGGGKEKGVGGKEECSYPCLLKRGEGVLSRFLPSKRERGRVERIREGEVIVCLELFKTKEEKEKKEEKIASHQRRSEEGREGL